MGLTQGQWQTSKSIKLDNNGHFIMLKSTFHIEDVTSMNIYTTNNTAATYINTTKRKEKQKTHC